MSFSKWLIIILGTWLIVSPWLLGFSALNLVLWNNVIVGVLIILATLWHFSDLYKR